MLSFHMFACTEPRTVSTARPELRRELRSATHHPHPAASPRYLSSRRLPRCCRGVFALDPSSLLSFGLSRHSPLTAVFLPFPFNRLRTLSFSVSSKSFACHSYENCRVYTNNSHSGTRHLPLITPHCTQVLSFHFLAHSFARSTISTFLFLSY